MTIASIAQFEPLPVRLLDVAADTLASRETMRELLREAAAVISSQVFVWHQMNHPDLETIKAKGTRIMIFVPRKVLPTGNSGKHTQFHEAKLVLTHWSRAVQPTKAVTPGTKALALDEKHGGFWAADRRGIKPVRGAPELWCYLPKIEGLDAQ